MKQKGISVSFGTPLTLKYFYSTTGSYMMHFSLPTKIRFLPTKCILCPDPPFFAQTPPFFAQTPSLFAHKISPRAFFTPKRLQPFYNPDVPMAPARPPPAARPDQTWGGLGKEWGGLCKKWGGLGK